MKKKLRSKNGSAMTLAIVVLIVVGICGTTMSGMLNNQIKSTKNNNDSINLDYQTEAEVETSIARYIDQIEVKGEKEIDVGKVSHDLLLWYFMITHSYTEIAETYTKYYKTEYSDSVKEKLHKNELDNPYPGVYTLIGDNGHIGKFELELESYISSECECYDECKEKDNNSQTSCKTCRKDNNKCSIEKIKKLKLKDLENLDTRFLQICTLLEETLKDENYNGKSRAIMELKKVLEVCREYLSLITNYTKDTEEGLKFSQFTLDECNEFIETTLSIISNTEYSYFEGDEKAYGSIGVLYRNINTLYNHTGNCNDNNRHSICKLREDMPSDIENEENSELLKYGIESFLDTENKDNTQDKLNDIRECLNNYADKLKAFKIENNRESFNDLYDFYVSESTESPSKKPNGGGSNNIGGGDHNIANKFKIGIEQELRFLSFLLGIYNNLEYGESGDGNNSGTKSSLKIEIPITIGENVIVDDTSLNDYCETNNIDLYKDITNNKYILKVNESSLNSDRVVFNIDINASVEENNIESTVAVIISTNMGENAYNVNYEVKSWNKVS